MIAIESEITGFEFINLLLGTLSVKSNNYYVLNLEITNMRKMKSVIIHIGRNYRLLGKVKSLTSGSGNHNMNSFIFNQYT